MSFSAIGDCQLVSQIYQYKNHRIACSVKVLPTPVTHFKREPQNVFHWMTADRWSRIESGLWLLLENLGQWQDAHKLHTELIIDHINVRVQASDTPHPATVTLLDGSGLTSKDLNLDIQLQYISHEDTTIVGVHTTKRKLATEAEANGSGRKGKTVTSGIKPKASQPEKLVQSKPKHIDADDEEDNLTVDSQPPAKIKRERRSISQGGEKEKYSSSASSSRQGKPIKKSQSPVQRGAKAGKGKVLKPKVQRPATSPEKPMKVEQMDGARFDALQRLDSMLDMPKPREVKILLLDKMGEADVLNTFEIYRSDFDKLFKERKLKPRTNCYMNIAHVDVLDILNKNIHEKMLKKLGEFYSFRSNHTTLLLNGLLPLWIVRLFMDTYKLSHSEAVQQIRDQMKYNTYLKALNDDPLSSDLDD
ncbi:uncharacterized protein CG4951 isoform X3 [Drosophila ficusphila]|uniref:uncharacterized protein CG4951 isoform X3 n=1 Tax=Drosophila ficusphila TaxID=30025 RepID=UPI0007E7D85E|nr:uncharacterized protein CG4951 isoform X3 [Drosophila ficusphila]